MADENPGAEVIGTDLSPIQPSWVAPNCKFIVDDVEDDWVYSNFDFVHGRGMAGSIKDWEKLYRQIFENLNPGGFLEMQEYETWIRSDDGTLDNCPCITEWQQKVDDASRAFGKRMNVASEQKNKMIAAGFEDVTEVVQKLPLGPWPKDPRQKEIGRYELVQMVAAVEPFTLAIFTRTLGWSNERAQALMEGVRNELKDRRNHLYALVYFIHGKKPEKSGGHA
ncbi:S-adenosyl-L-methionine-dependent methyltransferase [Rhexocercosporidium sp. MPI-PUGE-AT-0058]|nr:S-adenosyl-L-methionine-dependent methyltransferase [Rhexocercosporidium sp. MPI-PUGE-AT-0058]